MQIINETKRMRFRIREPSCIGFIMRSSIKLHTITGAVTQQSGHVWKLLQYSSQEHSTYNTNST